MSECVVRMEKPEKCFNCDLRYECNAFYAPGKPKPFMRGCMIVCQLPEGHGRLVDGDELYMTVKAHDTKRVVNQVRSGVIEEKHICLHDICQAKTIVPAEVESPLPKPTNPVPIRDVYYVMTECDAKTGTVKYEPRERIEL